jgi:glyoxylase-like metal-dependent hydrolase (beta-lactamase superfamily II)
MEVIPGIHQVRLPLPANPLEEINVYLVEGEEGWLLVDAGWNCPDAYHALDRQLAEMGLGLEAITQIVITHVHPDHYGLMGRLIRECGAKTAFHRRAADVIEEISRSREQRALKVARQLRENGVPEAEVAVVGGAFTSVRSTLEHLDMPDWTLLGGEDLSWGHFHFKVIFTPGHAPGHVCLYDRQKRVLLSGDHVLPGITPSVSMIPCFEEDPLNAYLSSLRSIEALDVAVVLPAHEGVFDNLQARVQDLLAHHDERLAHVLRALGKGAQTAYQVAEDMPWMTKLRGGREVSFADLDGISRGLATGETMAHLEHLKGLGDVGSEWREGCLFYHRQGEGS